MKLDWFWVWRRLHCLMCFRTDAFERNESERIDSGYCLDRYTTHD